ncbi:MAG TPA: GNAT family N-acetyltransferase [Symbiobacteriaceae bacterium]|jgi:GNAT superfamily N-acetyltransferase|nr:GNAT family N-acetyltransferase [Symbiobacteriaceae bacterium]
MTISLRNAQHADAPQIAEIVNQIDPDPVTPDQVNEWADNVPEGGIYTRMVALDGDRVVGWGNDTWFPWHKPGKHSVYVAVHPEARNRGAGAALAEALEASAREHGATEVTTDVRETEAFSVRFAEARGYRRDRHMFDSVLDVATFDDEAFAGVMEGLTASGIRFARYDELPPGEETDRKIYAVYAGSVPDIPGNDAAAFRPFDVWRKDAVSGATFWPDCFSVALDGDRVVGVTSMEWIEATGTMINRLTGVLKEYRGRQIALALKLHTLEAARRYGAAKIRTFNDADNRPMLAINRKMGFQPEPGFYVMRKDVNA